MATPQLDNLTEAVQRHLGLQQAQTFTAENITADAIARLTGKRGDVSRLFALWSDEANEMIDPWNADEHPAVLRALRRVLDGGLVVQRFANGLPKAFLPLSPQLITHKNTNTIFRDLGRSVVEGLWRSPELRKELATRIDSWTGHHPLAHVLSPLSEPAKYEDKTNEAGHLAEVTNADPRLLQWIDTVVAQDWRAWLAATAFLSVDEQIETMTALIALHLHVALLWRLRDLETPKVAPCYFVAVAGHGMDHACTRAAYNCYAFWGDRTANALHHVARQALQRAALEENELTEGLKASNWQRPGSWMMVNIKGQSKRATDSFHEVLKSELEKGAGSGRAPADGEILEVLTGALVRAFSGESGVASKVKDFLRATGRAVGLVGPDEAYARKRYQMDERALALLARMHAVRTREEIETDEEDQLSLEAFLDDIFRRYGIVITHERDRIRQSLESVKDAKATRSLLKHFPHEEPMRKNRAHFDRRLDELRFVRRYSDASAVVHVATGGRT